MDGRKTNHALQAIEQPGEQENKDGDGGDGDEQGQAPPPCLAADRGLAQEVRELEVAAAPVPPAVGAPCSAQRHGDERGRDAHLDSPAHQVRADGGIIGVEDVQDKKRKPVGRATERGKGGVKGGGTLGEAG